MATNAKATRYQKANSGLGTSTMGTTADLIDRWRVVEELVIVK